MKLIKPLIATASLALVGMVALWESDQLISPGPLHASHAALTALAGGDRCESCHDAATGGGRATAAACEQCHAEIAAQRSGGTGLHGALGDGATDCSSCHREHLGSSLPLVDDHAFVAAGVEDPSDYDHRHAAAFDLVGRHEELDCTACHPHAHAEALAEGDKRFLGLDTACTTCHEDPHQGSAGSDCARCHGQSEAFDRVAAFVHDARFPLTGGHVALACKQCHGDGEKFALAAPGPGSATVRACAACHADPHAGGTALPLPDTTACQRCHDTDGFRESAAFGVAEHEAIGVVLRGPHAGADCRSCHDQARRATARRETVMNACRNCHESPHRDAFLAGIAPSAADSCRLCHDGGDATFRRPAASMPSALHAATGFPLDAPHHRQACADCHGESTDFAAQYPGREPSDCRACHRDPHEGQFDAGPTAGRCSSCHAATHFVPSAFELDHHGRSRFPLTGAHQAVGCDRCHTAGAGRFVPTPSACAACHEDVHRGIFAAVGRGTQVDRTGCARCHDTESFAAIRMTATEHGQWTGYPLRGGHATANCTDCHRRSPQPDAQGRTFGRASRACADCHVDPHAGQFRRNGQTDCARCHGEEDFHQLRFDHQRDARFTLDKDHGKLGCSACHRPVGAAPGVEIVRYRPLGTRCQDCHGVVPKERR